MPSSAGRLALAEIVARELCPRYDVDPATALRDATELAHGLAERGILQVGERPFAGGGDAA